MLVVLPIVYEILADRLFPVRTVYDGVNVTLATVPPPSSRTKLFPVPVPRSADGVFMDGFEYAVIVLVVDVVFVYPLLSVTVNANVNTVPLATAPTVPVADDPEYEYTTSLPEFVTVMA